MTDASRTAYVGAFLLVCQAHERQCFTGSGHFLIVLYYTYIRTYICKIVYTHIHTNIHIQLSAVHGLHKTAATTEFLGDSAVRLYRFRV